MRLAIAIHAANFLTEIDHSFLDDRIGQRVRDGGVKLRNPVGRSILWRAKPVPGRDIETLEAGLVARKKPVTSDIADIKM